MANDSGNLPTIPGSRWNTVDITSADFVASDTDTLPLAFIQDLTGAVSFRSAQSGQTITRTFVGGVVHWIGSFDRIFAAATTANSISIVR
jgi:hypothetical protein